MLYGSITIQYLLSSYRRIFTARRVCIARTMPSQDVCPSVRLSHAGIVSKRLYTSSKISQRRVAPPLQFSHTKRDGNIPAGTSLTGQSKERGVWKNQDFRPISRFISQMMQDRAIVTMEGEWETAPKLSYGTGLNDLEWPLIQISRSWYHSTLNNAKTVPDRTILTMADQ